MSPADPPHDAIVVGGRVAGALTAARLAERGMSVLVLEARSFPSDTLSTHFFRGDGLVRSLTELGLIEDVLATGAPRLTCEYFYARGDSEPARNPPQEPGEVGYCLSVRRDTLDGLVAGRVAGLPGVDFRSGVRVEDVLRDGDGVVVGVRDSSGQEHRATVTVGADGRRSVVARRLDAGVEEQHPAARVMYYRYVSGWTGPAGKPVDGPEFSLSGNEMVYVFPSDGGTACVALTVGLDQYEEAHAAPSTFFARRLENHRGLWPRFAAATELGGLFCGLPQDSLVRTAGGPGWALVGDAGTYQDPWTGFGMDTAARQAEALGAVITADGVGWNAAYAEARDAVTLDRFHMTVQAAPDLSVLLA